MPVTKNLYRTGVGN